jgi:hypothetical protein
MAAKKTTSKTPKPKGAAVNSRAKSVRDANKGRKPLEAFMPKPGIRKRSSPKK